MALVFTVEDGTGLSNSNSYVSVEYADDYLQANMHVWPTWDALSVAEKEYLLIWATRYLDQRVRWNGVKTVLDSALRWPRTGVRDADGNMIDPNTIPPQLKEATAEMARFLLESDRSAERPQDGLESIKVDVIELVFNSEYRLPTAPEQIRLILSGLGYMVGNGMSFAPIRRT